MVDLTFGEQVKLILSRRGMTIKELAEQVEAYTGKPMSRQNMTQRLGRDNFQEQDMRMLADILGCPFTLSIMESVQETVPEVPAVAEEQQSMDLKKDVYSYVKKPTVVEVDTVGEVNPYTRKEYESNSVRIHPTRIGYVQVYDQDSHKWTEMTEWAFLGEQERKKALLGKEYKEPIYLD